MVWGGLLARNHFSFGFELSKRYAKLTRRKITLLPLKKIAGQTENLKLKTTKIFAAEYEKSPVSLPGH
jgi:hypothetical protein